MRNETNWYRCTTREEMVKLVNAGFDYTNFRKDKYNDGNNTYYFERTKELEQHLASIKDKADATLTSFLEEDKKDVDDRVIIKPAFARKLLKQGYSIKDVRPQKRENGEIDFTRCVFVFKAQDGLDKAISKLV